MMPDCRTPQGCLVPPLLPAAQRVMALRGTIVRLRGMVDAGTVLKMAGADMEDLENLALVESILLELEPKKREEEDG